MEVGSKTLDEIENTKETENLKTLEAAFFVSGRFLSMPEIISLTDLNPLIIKDLISKLKEKYDKQDSAIGIIEKSNMWKMDVAAEYSYLINKLATGETEFTKAEQETLAIIAFKQPIKQSILIKIRGNKGYDHVKKLSDLGLIRRKRDGHTNIITLADEFYDYFNVAEKNPLEKKGDEKLNEDSPPDEPQE